MERLGRYWSEGSVETREAPHVVWAARKKGAPESTVVAVGAEVRLLESKGQSRVEDIGNSISVRSLTEAMRHIAHRSLRALGSDLLCVEHVMTAAAVEATEATWQQVCSISRILWLPVFLSLSLSSPLKVSRCRFALTSRAAV